MLDQDKKMHAAIKNWLHREKFDGAFAVTLTLKQNVGVEKLTELSAKKTLRVFLNRFNRIFYGNAVKRYKKRIETIPILGRSYSGRLHYHLIMVCPTEVKEQDFRKEIQICWDRTIFGHREIEIKKITSNGWLEYMANHIFSAGEFDYENMHLNR